MKTSEDIQKVVEVITKCCEAKGSFDINIFDPTADETDMAMVTLGREYKRHDTIQDNCFVTHFKADNVCGYKTVEITMFRKRKKGGDKK